MDFNIYVLGDVRLFADTFNGIAMMFTVTDGEQIDMWASNTNSMGLGMGALLGMLFAICSLVYNAAFRQKFDFASLMFPLILYICLTVPKVSVNVIDGYYKDGAQTVDNVPLGLALPLSAISSISFTATEKLETIFTVPNNGTYTKITEDGFVMPLKLLHSLRYTGLTMRDGFPNLSNSLIEVTKICLTNNPEFNLNQYQNTLDSVGVLVSAMNSGAVASRLVKIYPHNNRNGMVVNCSMASSYIRGTLEAYMTGTVGSNPSLLAGNMLAQKNLKTDIEKILSTQNANTGSRNLTNTSTVRILDDIQNFSKSSNTEALNFIQASILNPQLSTASECTDSIDQNAVARCLSYATAEEQWKERSAAEASGFLGIMRDGQNLLILLSIILFPIMVLVIAIKGMGGIKVVSSYFLYTISAYMWIPVAAMINWFTQVQLHEEMQKWMARLPADVTTAQGFLALSNAPLFYDAISKKLAVANNVMAAVPVICMGLFSGMLWSMNRLSDKMNPQSNFDPTTNTPAAMERGALSSVGNTISHDGALSGGKINALPDAGSFQRVKEAAEAQQKAQMYLSKASESAAKAIGEKIATSKDSSITSSLAKDMMEQNQFTDQNQTSTERARQAIENDLAKFGLAHKFDQGENLTQEDMKQASLATGMNASLANKKNFGQIAGKLRASGMDGLAEKFEHKNGNGSASDNATGINGSNSNSWASGTGRSQSSMYGATSAVIGTVERATKTSDSENNTLNNSRSFNEALSDSRSNLNTYSEQDRIASSMSLTTSQLLNMDKASNGALSENLNKEWDKFKDADGVRDTYKANGQEFTNSAGASNAEFGARANAMLNGGNKEARQAAINALGGAGNYIGNVNGDHIGSAKTNGLYENVQKETAASWNVSAPPTSASKINKDANAIEGEVAQQQARGKAAANQTPTPRSVGDAKSPIAASGDKYMDGVNAAKQEGEDAIRLQQKTPDGKNARVEGDLSAAGFLGSISGDKGNESTKKTWDNTALLAKQDRGETLTGQEQKQLNSYTPADAVKFIMGADGSRATTLTGLAEMATGKPAYTQIARESDGSLSQAPKSVGEVVNSGMGTEGTGNKYVKGFDKSAEVTGAHESIREAMKTKFNNSK